MARFLFLFILSGLLLCSKENPLKSSVNKYQGVLEEVQAKVEIIRGLSFQRAIHFAILTRREYAEYNDSRVSSGTQLYSIELKQLGFIPDTMRNYGQQVESYDDEFAAAFYVPGTDSIYVIDAEKYDENEFKFYAAHELTHALQDHNFNPFSGYLYPAISQSTYNSDFYLAQLCVAEGDASLSGYLYYITGLPEISEQDVMDEFLSARNDFYTHLSSAQIPRFLQISSNAPYVLGQYFIANKKQLEGWKAVNDLYHEKRISSTAEIITSVPCPLVSFDFSKINPILLESTTNLRFADDDTHGPIMLMALISDYTDEQHCKDAFGWQGDRILYVLKDDNDYGSFVWALQFQTSEDADYMLNAFDHLLTNRRLDNIRPVRDVGIDSNYTYTHPEVKTTLIKQNNSIIWIENVDSPLQIAALLQTGALAKAASTEKDYSTLAKQEKWKLLKRLF